MRILITGSSGFLGKSTLARLSEKHEVYALSRHADSKALHNEKIIEGDLTNSNFTENLPAKMDSILHFAQSPLYQDFPNSANDIFSVNIAATQNLLEYARRSEVSQFIFSSTGSVYGPSDSLQNEQQRVAPLDYYGASKLAAEALMAPYSAYMNICTLRLFYLYGPAQQDKLVANLIRRIQNGNPLLIPGKKDGISLNPTYVEDVVTVIDNALENQWNGIYNVAGKETCTIRQLGETIADLCGVELTIENTGGEEPVSVIPDLGKIKTKIDLNKFTALNSGLKEMIARPLNAA